MANLQNDMPVAHAIFRLFFFNNEVLQIALLLKNVLSTALQPKLQMIRVTPVSLPKTQRRHSFYSLTEREIVRTAVCYCASYFPLMFSPSVINVNTFCDVRT